MDNLINQVAPKDGCLFSVFPVSEWQLRRFLIIFDSFSPSKQTPQQTIVQQSKVGVDDSSHRDIVRWRSLGHAAIDSGRMNPAAADHDYMRLRQPGEEVKASTRIATAVPDKRIQFKKQGSGRSYTPASASTSAQQTSQTRVVNQASTPRSLPAGEVLSPELLRRHEEAIHFNDSMPDRDLFIGANSLVYQLQDQHCEDIHDGPQPASFDDVPVNDNSFFEEEDRKAFNEAHEDPRLDKEHENFKFSTWNYLP